MPHYRWEPRLGRGGRYRDLATGRLVGASVVRRALDETLDSAEAVTTRLAEALRQREVSVADWYAAMQRHVKQVHLHAVALERGGWANMRPADYGRAGALIREQYRYLRRFAEQIVSGRQRLDGSLAARAGLYTKAGRESFYRSKRAHLNDGGGEPVTHVRSLRHPGDSCRECVDLDRVWHRLDDPRYRLPGQRLCSKNCRCDEQYGVLREGAVRVVG